MDDNIKRLLDIMVSEITIKAVGLAKVTDNMYEAAAAAGTTSEIADALYAAANEMHKSSEAMKNAASILETAAEKIW